VIGAFFYSDRGTSGTKNPLVRKFKTLGITRRSLLVAIYPDNAALTPVAPHSVFQTTTSSE